MKKDCLRTQLRGPTQHAGFGGMQVLMGKAWTRHPPVTLTKLLKSPSGMMLGSELPGISKVRARSSREMRGAGGRPLGTLTPLGNWWLGQEALTQGVEFVDHLFSVDGPFLLSQSKTGVRIRRDYTCPTAPGQTLWDLECKLHGWEQQHGSLVHQAQSPRFKSQYHKNCNGIE